MVDIAATSRQRTLWAAVTVLNQPETRWDAERVTNLEQAVDALTGPHLAHIVDLVGWPEGDGDGRSVIVANSRGRARLRGGEAETILDGSNPVANQDPMAFLPYESEIVAQSPANSANAYPYAADRLLSLFADHARSPDLVVVHTPKHYFPESGGHRGEHGSLDVIQSRAPLLISGPGARFTGLVDDHARLIDVGPTLAWLAGAEPSGNGRFTDRRGRPLDGEILHQWVERGAACVVGLLWDGAHCGDLLYLASQGGLPNVARLLERGGALRGGAVAEFPSLTLANHTSILTGVGVGRHGVLGNAFYDRQTRTVINANDATAWHRWPEWVRLEARTIFELVSDTRPEAITACINEPADRGATYSTMQLIRANGAADGANAMNHLLPDPTASPYLGNPANLDDAYYAWATQADDIGLEQILGAFADRASAPALTWWASAVTDAGHHAGGPRSEVARDSFADADRRLGKFLDHLDRLGIADDVTFLLTADHGFEAADVSCQGEWGSALEAAGVPFRDVGSGFIYLTPTS